VQDAFAQAGLHLGHGIRIHASGRVEDDTRRTGLHQESMHTRYTRLSVFAFPRGVYGRGQALNAALGPLA
jgi:hypothetical protein